MDHAHPTDRITTSPLTYDHSIAWFAQADHGVDFPTLDFDGVFPSPASIGHDVWIGNGSLLGSGIRIGHGAIVGARSIVTRDVPPYSLVAGAPAVVRKMRYSDRLVARFLEASWWDYAFHKLPTCWRDAEQFLDELEDGVGRGTIPRLDPQVVDVGRELFMLDEKLREG